MPKLLCKCGETLMLREIPCPIEFQLISEKAIDEHWETLRAENLRELAHDVVKCDTCGRLHVFWKGGEKDEAQVSYIPEQNESDDATPGLHALGLSDSELIGYERTYENLTVRVRLWDESTASIQFAGFAGLLENAAWEIASVTESPESEFLRRCVERLFDGPTSGEARDYRSFIFSDPEGEPVIEVIAKSAVVRT